MNTEPITWRSAHVAAAWLMDRVHVSTSYDTVAADGVSRAEANYPNDRRRAAAASTAFVIHHRRNRRLYQEVLRHHG